jgi:hypothetical protein
VSAYKRIFFLTLNYRIWRFAILLFFHSLLLSLFSFIASFLFSGFSYIHLSFIQHADWSVYNEACERSSSLVLVSDTPSRLSSQLINAIEDPYTSEQLTSPRVNTLVVRPLVDRLYDPDDMSIGLLAYSPLCPFRCFCDFAIRLFGRLSVPMCFRNLSEQKYYMSSENGNFRIIMAHMMGCY